MKKQTKKTVPDEFQTIETFDRVSEGPVMNCEPHLLSNLSAVTTTTTTPPRRPCFRRSECTSKIDGRAVRRLSIDSVHFSQTVSLAIHFRSIPGRHSKDSVHFSQAVSLAINFRSIPGRHSKSTRLTDRSKVPIQNTASIVITPAGKSESPVTRMCA